MTAVLVTIPGAAIGAGAAPGPVATVTPATAAVAPGPAPLTPLLARRLSEHVTRRVIVVLRDRLASTRVAPASARREAAASAQRSVLADLHRTGSRRVEGLSLVDDVVATVSAGEEARLRHDPAVAEVVADQLVRMAAPVRPGARQSRFSAAAGACRTGTVAQLDPQALEVIHAATQSGEGHSAQALGYTGAGVKVGFIADGIDTDNPDLVRADGRHVFVGYHDFTGLGTGSPTGGAEAFLDASSIAAQGRRVYNLENYGTGLDQACYIRILGVAPGASLVDLDTFGSGGSNFTSALLEAIDYGTTHSHLDVLDESFGDNPFPDVASLDLVEQADSAAVARGVTVTVSSGDAGPTGTIASPATDPVVISAGASTTFRAYLQAGVAGAVGGPVKVKGWDDDNISAFSSGGVSEAGRTVDVVAPGDLNWALCTPDPSRYRDCYNDAGRGTPVELTGGTSEAAPLTAGTAALVIQAYRGSHRGASPTPAIVKRIITSTAEDVRAPGDLQGAGMIDAYAAVLAARSYAGVAAGGHAVLTTTSQLDAAGPSNTTRTLRDSVTDDGSGPVTVGLSSRTLGAYRNVKTGTYQLLSVRRFRSVLHFTVPAGTARLDARVAYVAAGGLSEARELDVTLYNPRGDLAAFDYPQGPGQYGDAEATDPGAGRWTALVSGFGPTTVHFGAAVAAWTSFGAVTPASITLAAGATRGFALRVATPAGPGDSDGSVVLRTTATRAPGPDFAASTSVAVVLRSYVPVPDPTTSFAGTLTGGNGRSSGTGQSVYYEVDLPSGEPTLSADVGTAQPTNTFTAELVGPDGTTGSAASNVLLTGTVTGSQATSERGTQLHVVAPSGGVWTLAVDFYGQVAATAVSEPFSVTMSTATPAVSAVGLPDSAATQLRTGRATEAGIRVTNTGDTPEEYFVDGRLDTTSVVALGATDDPAETLPSVGTVLPTYLVPAATSSVTATVTSPTPALFSFAFVMGDPDDIAGSGPRTDRPTGTFASGSRGVPSGPWTIVASLDGPDGVAGYRPTRVDTAMTATTRTFDPAVTSPTGDLWRSSTGPGYAITPYLLDPGQTASIPVVITPTAPPGSTVRGTLYLDDDSLLASGGGTATESGPVLGSGGGLLPDGSELAALPYEYTVTSSSSRPAPDPASPTGAS